MSIRFAIRNTEEKAKKEGEQIVRFSGTSEPYHRVSEREGRQIGVDVGNNPMFTFTTGLNPDKVQYYRWYNDEEKKAIVKKIKELKPLISSYYGGEEVIDEHNAYFWKDNRDVNRLSITPEDIDVFFDTSKPAHALLYLGIISGAFIDLIAPTKDWADRYQLPHYMVLDTDEIADDDEEITKSDAHALLGELRKDASPEALFILAWCIQYDTTTYGAYLKSIPQRELINYHIKYIDGKLQFKRKKNAPKTFIQYAEKWKGQQTRPALYVEAYVKAGEYFNFLHKRDSDYTTPEGVAVGMTIPEVVENLQKQKFSAELELLRDRVESKWKE